MFEIYAKEETENEGSGIDFDPDLRSPRLPYDPLVADQLSSSGSTSAEKIFIEIYHSIKFYKPTPGSNGQVELIQREIWPRDAFHDSQRFI